MSPLETQMWWEFGLWCMVIAIFGSFVKSFAVDNITSIKDIFKQVIMSLFVVMVFLIYGSYQHIDRKLQLIGAAFAGIVGLQGVFYVTGKLGGFLNDIGDYLQGLNISKTIKDIPKEKRFRILPQAREQRKRDTGHDKK